MNTKLGRAKTRWGEEVIRVALLMCGLVGVLTTFGIIITLFQQTWAFFGDQPMSMDAAVVVSRQNETLTAISDEQLATIFHPESRITRWGEVDASWPDEEMNLYVPAGDAILLEQMAVDLSLPEKKIRTVGVKTYEDFDVLKEIIAADRHALAIADGSMLSSSDIGEDEPVRRVEAYFRVSLWEFFFGTEWYPLFHPPRFGILPLLWGTMLVAVGAAVIAIPLGVGAAVYLAEYASHRTRSFLKPVLELLAGVPTVVYGYFALTFITPALRKALEGYVEVSVYNAAAGAIVVGIMILPMIASLCDDAFRAVPSSLRQGAYALGATPLEVNSRVVFPAALSGVLASFLLAMSRAVGETMAVTMAAGAMPRITLSPFESIQTLTAYIVSITMGDTPAGSTAYLTVFAVGMVLFLLTLLMNVVANRVMHRFREEYE